MQCYRVYINGMGLSWFILARTIQEATAKAIQEASGQLCLLPRAVRVSDWSSAELATLIESKAFYGLSAGDKVACLIAELRNTINSLARTSDYVALMSFINSMEA